MRFIAWYSYKVTATARRTHRIYVRNEFDPNAASWATRFDTREQAEQALREIRENIGSFVHVQSVYTRVEQVA